MYLAIRVKFTLLLHSLNVGISCSAHTALSAREKCLKFLHQKLCRVVELTEHQKNDLRIYDRMKEKEFVWIDNFVGIHPFFIPRGKTFLAGIDVKFVGCFFGGRGRSLMAYQVLTHNKGTMTII